TGLTVNGTIDSGNITSTDTVDTQTLQVDLDATVDGDAIIGDTLTVNNDGGDDEGLIIKGGGTNPFSNNKPGWIGFGREPGSIVGYMFATTTSFNFQLTKPADGTDIGIINFNLNSGLIRCADLTFNAANPDIIGFDTDGVLSITAGNTTILGGNIKLYGDTHSTLASDIELYSNATLVLSYDADETNWDFDGENVIGMGTVDSGAITSSGLGTFQSLLINETYTASQNAVDVTVMFQPASAAQNLIAMNFQPSLTNSTEDVSSLQGVNGSVVLSPGNTYDGTLTNATCFAGKLTLAGGGSRDPTVTNAIIFAGGPASFTLGGPNKVIIDNYIGLSLSNIT
ncbi:hypothetical protein LCGC14_3128750, partial [marine sediment metagenome]